MIPSRVQELQNQCLAHQNIWMLSFGDLLTLVLCVFLLLIGSGFYSIGQDPTQVTGRNTSSQGMAGTLQWGSKMRTAPLSDLGGKTLAPPFENKVSEDVFLTAEEPQESWAQRLAEAVEGKDQADTVITVEGCARFGLEDTPVAEGRIRTILAALKMTFAEIRYRSLDYRCEGIRTAQFPKAVGKVTIKSHG